MRSSSPRTHILLAGLVLVMAWLMLPRIPADPLPVVPVTGPSLEGYSVSVDTLGPDLYLVTVHDRVRGRMSEAVFLTLGHPVRRLEWVP